MRTARTKIMDKKYLVLCMTLLKKLFHCVTFPVTHIMALQAVETSL